MHFTKEGKLQGKAAPNEDGAATSEGHVRPLETNHLEASRSNSKNEMSIRIKQAYSSEMLEMLKNISAS